MAAMKLFLWESVDGVSSNYHDEGGVVIIADSLEHARELWNEERYRKDCEIHVVDPDAVYVLDPNCIWAPTTYAFPNAGCC